MGYYNGCFGELEDMYIPMNDRVCAFGDGVYDAAYCYNHKIFALDEHIARFYESAKLLGLNLNISPSDLNALIKRLVEKVKDDKLFVYWQATRGTAPREHAFNPDMPANLWIIIKHGELRDMTSPAKVILEEDRRHKYCNIKTLNLIPNILAAQKVAEMGMNEVIFHRNGRITECCHSNINILKNGKLITPPSDNLILSGIGRAHLIAACKALNIECEEKEFYIDDLFEAEEIIITAAGSLCIEVGEIDGKPVGGKNKKLLNDLRSYLINEFCAFTGIEHI